jgi:hypothetical protein
MGVRVHNGQTPPLGALLRELAEGSASLIRQEIRLVRLEAAETLGSLAKGLRDIELMGERMSTTLQQLEQKMNVMQVVRANPWPALAVAVGLDRNVARDDGGHLGVQATRAD